VKQGIAKASTGSVTVFVNTAPTLNQYVVSLKRINPWLNKYCLKEILKHNPFQQRGFVAIGAKADGTIVVLNVEKDLNTDDVVGAGGYNSSADLSITWVLLLLKFTTIQVPLGSGNI
jgi:hypothetical protein